MRRDHSINQMSSSSPSHSSIIVGTKSGGNGTIGSGVRRSIIFPRRSSLSRAASSFLSSKKGSEPSERHQAKFTASAANIDPDTSSSPLVRRRRRPLKSCLSSSSLHSSFSSSFSSLDSSSSSISSYEHRLPTKSVSFDKVQVREYGITKGCETSCLPSGGPPISLSWYYNPTEAKICIDQYEKCKATRTRRTSRELILSPRQRVAMILEHDNHHTHLDDH